MASVSQGGIVRYQLNASVGNGTAAWLPLYGAGWGDIEQAVRSAATAAGLAVLDLQAYADDNGVGNLQANVQTYIARDSDSIKGVLDNAVRNLNGVQIMASAINVTSPGGQVPGTIPAPIQQDTYHDKDTILGTATQFWGEQVGAQVAGLADALAKGSTLMWVGIAVVAYLILKDR